MKLDITQILGGKIREMEFCISVDSDTAGLYEYLPEDVRLTAPVGGTVKVTDRGEYISVQISPEVDYEVPCSRCLAPVKGKLSFSFERIIPSGSRFTMDEELCDEEDILTVVEGHIDITSDICEEIALEMPDWALCRDDCPGLCPKCGKSLSEGDCGCKKEKEIDPRMKIFEKLLQDEE